MQGDKWPYLWHDGSNPLARPSAYGFRVGRASVINLEAVQASPLLGSYVFRRRLQELQSRTVARQYIQRSAWFFRLSATTEPNKGRRMLGICLFTGFREDPAREDLRKAWTVQLGVLSALFIDIKIKPYWLLLDQGLSKLSDISSI